MTFLKTLLDSIILFLNMTLHKMSGGKEFLIDKAYKARETQATYIYAPQKPKVLWLGDSRQMEFEAEINGKPGHANGSVAGSKLREGLLYGAELAKIVKPKIILEDFAGNDFLAGRHLDDIIADKKKLREQLKKVCANVYTFEIGYLSPQAASNPKIGARWVEINAAIKVYNTLMAIDLGDEFIRLNDLLGEGVMRPEYDLDGVHWNPTAWTTVVWPRAQEAMKRAGIA